MIKIFNISANFKFDGGADNESKNIRQQNRGSVASIIAILVFFTSARRSTFVLNFCSAKFKTDDDRFFFLYFLWIANDTL